MANSYIPIDAPAVEDFKLDTEQLTVGANTVERERMQIAGTAAADICPVSATDGVLVNLGSNNDVTVAGVATAAKQDTGNTALAAIQAAVEGTVVVDGSGVTQPISHAALTELAAAIDTEVQVDVVSSALPTGAATSAKQDTVIGHLDGVEGLLTTLAGAVSGTEMQVDVVAALPAGDNNIGNVDIASAIPAGSSLIGRVNVDPQTANGLSIFRSLDLDETEEEVKGSAGQVYGMWVANLATTTRYLKFYNATAANVTVGTTTPVITIPIPGNATDDIAGFTSIGMGIAFGTAITVAVTTGLADNDTGAPGANEVVVNIFYK